ncbi:MAG: L-serine ammonia-lyase, iron-sulfur-dependent subunit beta [Sporomusaceae bacterium]|nr:L-serine ammonia-lyase, iron-sulfur-dependent subunit beta [Sporomusaceae bacterium]
MGVFDIVGPVMIGPSSSHTAGAVRLGKMARTILGEAPRTASISLYGSFARTYKGHGTDKALVAGLLGFDADDTRIKNALELAAASGLQVAFQTAAGAAVHPNTAHLQLSGVSGKTAAVGGASLGGGSIVINRIDDYEVEISGQYHALITIHQDKPGMIAMITQILAQQGVNIAFMKVSRQQKGVQALMVLETDQPIPEQVLAAITPVAAIEAARLVKPL